MPDLFMVGLNNCIKLDNFPFAAVISFCGRVSEIQRLTVKH